jgi:hypothetical protein
MYVLGKAFAVTDTDHDHRVSINGTKNVKSVAGRPLNINISTEFIAGHKALGINEDDAHLKAEFGKIDTNHGGCIQYYFLLVSFLTPFFPLFFFLSFLSPFMPPFSFPA